MTTDNVFSTYDLMSDLAANRPATPAVSNGRLSVFMATDTGDLSFWDATNSKWRTKIEPIIGIFSLVGSAFTPSPFGSYDTIPLDTVEIDTANGWNSGTHAYTVPVTGKYLLSASAGFAVTTASLLFQVLAIWKNGTGTGTNILSGATTPPTGTVTDITVLGAKIFNLTAGDVLTLAIFMQGTSGSVQNTASNTYITIQRIA